MAADILKLDARTLNALIEEQIRISIQELGPRAHFSRMRKAIFRNLGISERFGSRDDTKRHALVFARLNVVIESMIKRGLIEFEARKFVEIDPEGYEQLRNVLQRPLENSDLMTPAERRLIESTKPPELVEVYRLVRSRMN